MSSLEYHLIVFVKWQCSMRNKLIVIKKIFNCHDFFTIKMSCLYTLWLCGLPLSLSGLGDFDNLHAEQLDFRLAILQHLLGCGQHLPILGSDNRSDREILRLNILNLH